MSHSDNRIVVVIASVEEGQDHVRELSRERYVARSVGAALDAHAPDPAPGARFEVEVTGRAREIA